jgi:hypothetical protein
MRFRLARQFAFPVLLIAVAFVMMMLTNLGAQPEASAQSVEGAAEHGFDFLVGSWTVEHRRLKHRLAHSTEWETFTGTSKTWGLMDGQGDVDDNVLHAPAGTYRAVTLRSFDKATKSWSIWWLDSRHPHDLDPPVVGTFHGGIGTFLTKDTFNGRPVIVRYIWSDIAPNSAKWQQAFSDDDGKTWETNWIMEFRRLDSVSP